MVVYHYCAINGEKNGSQTYRSGTMQAFTKIKTDADYVKFHKQLEENSGCFGLVIISLNVIYEDHD